MKYTRPFLLTLALLGASCLFPAPAQAAWIDTDWPYRNPVRIDATRVVNTDQTDFPILVSHTDLAWRDVANGGQVGRADGGDILFTAADGSTQLDHEIETYDPTTGKLVAWVRMPSLSATIDTDLYIYYGNASAADQANPTGVWDSNFMAVYHLDEDPSGPAPQIKDRTTSVNHGTTEGTMLSAASVPAKIGRGLQFDGVDDLIRVLDSTSLDGTADAATFEVWIRWTNSADGDHQNVMVSSNRFDPTTPDGFEWATQGDGDHFFYPRGYLHDNHNLGPNPFTDGVFQQMWLTLEYATREVKIFVDGTEMTFTYEGAPTYWNQEAAPQDWLWGGDPGKPTRHLDGVLDEIRVSDVIRSGDWLQTSLNNQSSPATFHAVQGQEGVPIHAITGTVFEDTDFAGTASAYDGGTNDLALANVDVELYDGADAYVASTSTAGDGSYSFSGLVDGNYKVRVRSASIGDLDTPPAGGLNSCVPDSMPYPLAEMIWGNSGALLGGQDPTVDDADTEDNAGPGDSYVALIISGADISGVELGFAYNLIVNTEDDALPADGRSHQGSLRQFIKNANAIGPANGTTASSSQFNIGGGGLQTIAVQAGGLPYLLYPMVLDATTQPNPTGSPLIQLDGSGATGATAGLALRTDASTVKGFIVHSFPDEGIEIDGSTGHGDNNTIQFNWVGIDDTGAEKPNTDFGVMITVGASGNQIGGESASERNIIAGNSNSGVIVRNADSDANVIIGNWIGLAPDGITPAPNAGHGIEIDDGAQDNMVGGPAGMANRIAYNQADGIYLSGAGTDLNMIGGNSLFSNVGLGINLAGDGANDDKSAPTLTGLSPSAGDFIATVTSAAADTIQFFRVNNAAAPLVNPDGSGSGEGYLYLGLCVDGGNCEGPHMLAVPDGDPTAGGVQGTILGSGFSTGDYLTATASDPTRGSSDFAGNVEMVSYEISGLVFEDTDFAGIATVWDGGAVDSAQPNVDVELYTNADAYINSTTTDASGNYSFTGLTDGTYKVRVRSATLGDVDTPPSAGFNTTVPGTWPYPLAEMTWGYGSALIGGQDPQADDSVTGDNAGPGDTYVTVTVSVGDVSGVNFGFNYELIVNEDDDANTDGLRSKQGTLRQFIKNSNAIVGVNKSWFQIP